MTVVCIASDRSVNVEPSVCSRIQEHDTLFFSQAEIGAENMIHKEHIQQQYEQVVITHSCLK